MFETPRTDTPSVRRVFRLIVGAASVILSMGLGAGALAASSGQKGVWSFASEPHLHPPKLRVLERKAGLAPGNFLVNTMAQRRGMTGQPGPLILDSKAQPIWFMHTADFLDFEQETYEGKPVLVLEGRALDVLNEHYRSVATLEARSPWTLDGHDASIIGKDVWVTVLRRVRKNLTAYGGPRKGSVIDCGVQEYQLSTGLLIRTWDALKHVPLSTSKTSPGPRGWDAYHLNAVQALPNGDLLVSMRNTWAVYLINPVSGHILWTLGGTRSTFTLGQRGRFAWQHDAKLVQPGKGGLGSNVELTLFNDNSQAPSAGEVLDLNTSTDRATLVAAYHHHPPVHAHILGSMQVLANRNALVGWATGPYFSEYSKSGTQLLNVKWPAKEVSYRALLSNTWVGTPYYPPRGAVRGTTAYASWNGATQVAKWQVLAGAKTRSLKVVASARRSGFETAISLGKRFRIYKVRALNGRGQTLGTSKTFS